MRSTLSRTWRGETRPHLIKCIEQQLPTPEEERELVEYMNMLTVQHAPPTRDIIADPRRR